MVLETQPPIPVQERIYCHWSGTMRQVARKGAQMATQTASQTTTTMTRRRFTVAEYQRMGEVGIFTEDDRVELIAGEILQMSPIGVRHARCVARLTRILSRQAGPDMLVGVQNPIYPGGENAPEPDLSILRDRDPDDLWPTLTDIFLVMEVSDSTLAYDRGTKLPLYATAGIAEAWIVDLAAATVERHTEPRDGFYHLVASARPGESLASTVLPALTILVADILIF
jgi:Uma2 family endonuclease